MSILVKGKEPETPDADEATYQATVKLVRSGANSTAGWTTVLLLALVIASVGDIKSWPVRFVLVVGVYVLEDLARLLGASLLNYPDKWVFSVPLFQKALPASGDRVEAWKRGLLLLLGPISSLFLVFIIAVATRAIATKTLVDNLLIVVVLNTFSLMPFGSLEGSRFLNLVIFSRSRVAQVIFLVSTALAIIAVGLLLESYILVVPGVFGLLLLPRSLKIRSAAAEVAQRSPGLNSRIEDLDEETMRGLFEAAQRASPRSVRPEARAIFMREIHNEALVPPPALASILLLALYGAGLVLAVVTLVLLATARV
jgi:hypothetical protein